MSKVICDVCGTTYPETAAQCPICNSAKNTAEQTAAGSGKGADAAGYVPVKGGRFSKKNVRRRNKKGGSTAQRRSSRQNSSKDEPSNTGLVVVVVLLLLAIVAVVIYIAMHFFGSPSTTGKPDTTTTAPTQTQSQTQSESTEGTTVDTGIHCESLELSNKILEFTAEGETWTLVVAVTPVDTTDSVSFESSDPSVVTVSDSGVITAVGGGEAVITVTCGDASSSCTVTCAFGEIEPSTEPTETVVTGEFDFEFNTAYVDSSTGYGDATLSAQGKTWKAYKSSLKVDPSEIIWTSDDTSVCTVENGIVTAVGPGKTLIHAQYNGVTYSCLIRCAFTVSDSGSSGSTSSSGGSCTINKTDVSISVGETFKLTLKDASGNVLDVIWSANGDNVTISGNSITGASSGTVTVSTTYDGETYSCIVRVK